LDTTNHSHDPKKLRQELLELLQNYGVQIEFLSAAASPLASIATSTSVLTFVSLQLFFNGIQSLTRILAGFNILLLLIMVFVSLFTQIVIYRAKIRLARVNHDLKTKGILECEEFSDQEVAQLIQLSHLAQNASKIIDRIQWLYLHGLFRVFYAVLTICIGLLIYLVLSEIPSRI
jgi:hypothetical protein